jgi:hypothetical protein
MQFRHGARPLSFHPSQGSIWRVFRIYLYLYRHEGSSTCPGRECPVRPPPPTSGRRPEPVRGHDPCSARADSGEQEAAALLKHNRDDR